MTSCLFTNIITTTYCLFYLLPFYINWRSLERAGGWMDTHVPKSNPLAYLDRVMCFVMRSSPIELHQSQLTTSRPNTLLLLEGPPFDMCDVVSTLSATFSFF